MIHLLGLRLWTPSLICLQVLTSGAFSDAVGSSRDADTIHNSYTVYIHGGTV